MLQHAKRIAEDSETNANRNRLIEQNERLVHRIAHKFKGYSVEYDELVAAGMLGLVEAAQTFAPSLGYQFTTHAWWPIVNAIKAVLPREAAQWLGYEQTPRGSGEGIEHAVARLPQRQGHVVRARLAGKTQAAIARELKISGAAVCKLEARAVVRLREDVDRVESGRDRRVHRFVEEIFASAARHCAPHWESEDPLDPLEHEERPAPALPGW